MQLNGLLEFIDLNRTGFRKALKKQDKALGGLSVYAVELTGMGLASAGRPCRSCSCS